MIVGALGSLIITSSTFAQPLSLSMVYLIYFVVNDLHLKMMCLGYCFAVCGHQLFDCLIA